MNRKQILEEEKTKNILINSKTRMMGGGDKE